MYHLARSLYLQWTSKPEYSIILLGLDNAGKTTLMSQIKAMYNTSSIEGEGAGAGAAKRGSGSDGLAPPSSTAGNTVPTVGQNVATIELPDMYLKIWDVGGQMTLRRLWTSYYKSAHAVVFVVDSTDLGSGDVEDLDGGGGIAGIGGVGLGVVGAGGAGDAGGGAGAGAGAAAAGLGPPRGWTAGRKKSHHFATSPLQQQQDSDATPATPTTPVARTRLDGEPGKSQSHLHPPQTPGTPMTPWTPIMSPLMADFGRLDECRAVLESVLSHQDTAGIPILVLANKQDREDCLEVVRIKEGFVRKVFEGGKGGMVRDSRVLPVSALKGTGVKEAVDWVKSRVLWNKEARPPVMR